MRAFLPAFFLFFRHIFLKSPRFVFFMRNAMAKNTIISEKQVADMRVFTVSEVELDKSGRRVHHSVIRFCGTASVLAITKEGNILLEKQYRTPIDRWIYEIPAGKIDKGEAPEHCIVRELEEETGYRPVKLVKSFEAYTSCGCSDEYMHYFTAIVEKIPEGERKLFPEIDEDLEIIEVSRETAEKMIAEKQIVDAKSIMLLTALKAGTTGIE